MGTRTLLIGLGKGGSALMPYLLANPQFDLVAVCDSSPEALGRALAERCGIPYFQNAVEAVKSVAPQLVIDASGDPSLPNLLYEVRPAGTSLVTAEASKLLWDLLFALEGRRRAELRYDRLLDDMNTSLVVVQNGRIRFVNSAFLHIFGYTREQILAHPYSAILEPSVREADMDRYHKRISGASTDDEYDTKILHADGSVRQVVVRAKLSEWDGQPASLVMLADVTTLRQLQRERERFFRFMVHELRAPLSPLLTAVSLLNDPGILGDNERLRRLLPLISRSTDRLHSFMDDFIQLSKLDEQALRIAQRDVDLAAIIRDIVGNQGILAEQKGVTLSVEPWEPFAVRGDDFVVRSLVQNLVNNAVKYTDAGSVTVSVGRDADTFTVRVSDTGMGLSEEERKNLFQEFGRIQRMAGVKGSGLGLALVKTLVDACGGTVSVESEGKDKGSIFSFTLPRVFGDPKNN